MKIEISVASDSRRGLRVLGTSLLLLLLAAVFAAEWMLGAVGNDARLFRLGALTDNAPLGGAYWRLVSFGLLHSSLTHLLLNGVLLVVAGPIVERRTSGAWLLFLFFAASIASGMAIVCKHAFWPVEGVTVGASGGMFGLLGAGLVIVIGRRGSRLAAAALTILLVCGLAYSLRPHVSMTGHLTGLLVGAALMAITRLVRSEKGWS